MQYDNRYEEAVCYDYDSAGNLISYQKNGEPIKSFLFSRGQSIPMATVINARYAPEANMFGRNPLLQNPAHIFAPAVG